MGYSEALNSMRKYRKEHIAASLGEERPSWFTELWGAIPDMLGEFNADKENSQIAQQYASAPSAARVSANIQLDYVCALRRDVRKQYISGDSDVYTDVTPFRHGAFSAHGARIFDDALDQLLTGNG